MNQYISKGTIYFYIYPRSWKPRQFRPQI